MMKNIREIVRGDIYCADLNPVVGSEQGGYRPVLIIQNDMGNMDQLVQSIKERGIITPVTLRPKEDGRYEIVSGHRRKNDKVR